MNEKNPISKYCFCFYEGALVKIPHRFACKWAIDFFCCIVHYISTVAFRASFRNWSEVWLSLSECSVLISSWGGNNLFIFIYDALCIRFVLAVFICSSTGQRFGLVSGTHLRAFGGSLCRNRFIYLFAPKRDHIGEPEKSPFFRFAEKVCCRCCCCLLPSNLTLWTAWN